MHCAACGLVLETANRMNRGAGPVALCDDCTDDEYLKGSKEGLAQSERVATALGFSLSVLRAPPRAAEIADAADTAFDDEPQRSFAF